MIKYLIFSLCITLVMSDVVPVIPSQACTCSQILSQSDCQQNTQCYWNNSCTNNPTDVNVDYCSTLTQTQCTVSGCAYSNKKCIRFPGCTAFLGTTTDVCLAINSQCVSDGTQCVQLSECIGYLSQSSCSKDVNGRYCTFSNSSCSLTTQCSQLPTVLNTDLLCRNQISTCTTQDGGGCIDSGLQCSDQKIQAACVWNKTKSQACYWNSTSCVDKTCANAPQTITTHADCQKYLSTCTVNSSQKGCIDIPASCQSLTIQDQCQKNQANQNCYWSTVSSKCSDKSCDFAPSSFGSHDQCQSFINTCTLASSGSGCMTIPSDCTQLTISANCFITSSGQKCYWNGTACVVRSCENVILSDYSYNSCLAFDKTCTTNATGTKCQQKASTCSDYTTIVQCITDINGLPCVFQSTCLTKTCANALTSLTTNETCQQYSSTCIVNSNNAGCQDKTCNVVLSSALCTTDLNGKQCYWGEVCKLRTCQNAPTALLDDASCRNYLSTCTVNLNQQGCTTRTASACEQITNAFQCVTPIDSSILCSWNTSNNSCRVKNCLDAPTTNTTHQQCNAFMATCTVNSSLAGCVAQMSACTSLTEGQCNAVVLTDGSKCSFNIQCRARICTDATTQTTDAACRTFLPTCTINLTSKGCINELGSCEVQTQAQCSKFSTTLCGWTGCGARTCANAPVLLGSTLKSNSDCATYLTGCIPGPTGKECVDGTGVVCAGLTQVQCPLVILSSNQYCIWSSNSCRNIQCTDIVPTTMNDANCSAKILNCTAGSGACQPRPGLCTGQAQAICNLVVNSGLIPCYWNGTDCVNNQCSFATPASSYTTDALCYAYMQSCTLGESSAGCAPRPSSCSGVSQFRCNQIFLISGGTCSWNGTVCQARACADYTAQTGQGYSDAICSTWLSTCTVNSTQDKCMTRQTDCTLYSKSFQCYFSSSGQRCFFNQGLQQCQLAVCSNASTLLTSNDSCQQYLTGCTVASGGGCTTQPTSCQLVSQTTCNSVQLAGGTFCYYAGSACRDRACSDAPTTYNTLAQCQQWKINCTVAISGQGCSDEPNSCSLAVTQLQCGILSNGTKCGWNTGCTARTCQSAPTTITTDADCRSYLSSCTVSTTGTGCMPIPATCAGMTTQAQCVALINFTTYCQWNNGSCQNRSCANAPTSLTTDSACGQYLSTCTVNASGSGCFLKQSACSIYTSSGQCLLTTTNTPCTWVTGVGCFDQLATCQSYIVQTQCTKAQGNQFCTWINNSCVNRTCGNAPTSYTTHSQCNTYLNTCTTNGRGCILISQNSCAQQIVAACYQGKDGQCTTQQSCNSLSCSIAPVTYITDAQCIGFLSTCTTNGAGCVQRLRCVDAVVQEGCKTDQQGNQCEWVNNSCVMKSCSTAPLSYLTELQCQSYTIQQNCTTKLGGGCVVRGLCSDATVAAACTTDYKNTQCAWVNNQCYVKACQIYYGPTFTICNSQNSKCTSDGYRCQDFQICSQYSTQVSCVQGLDGICLWNNGCYKFNSCYDIILTTHQQCNQFYSQCTTDGVRCIPITLCAKYKQLNCYQGVDSQCVWTPTSLSITSVQQCQAFTQCSGVFYSTHSDCYTYTNGKCTTNLLRCDSLKACSDYTIAQQCYVNLKGQELSTLGKIQSTGKCVYDTTTSKCRDVICTDLTGSSHLDCNSQLSSCTYNGKGCVTQTNCSNYTTQLQCENVFASDGRCYWNNTCQALTCSSYPVSSCSVQSANCVSDTTTCIVKPTTSVGCSNYISQIGCNNDAQDGSVCYWDGTSNQKGSCKQVTKCSDTSSNQASCLRLSDRCYFTPTNGTTASSCNPLQCDQYNTNCVGFYNFLRTSYTMCQKVGQNCTTINPTNLTLSTCYSQTLYTYTWNNSTNQCSVCNSTSTNNTTPNGTNNTNTTKVYGIILITSIIMIMI